MGKMTAFAFVGEAEDVINAIKQTVQGGGQVVSLDKNLDTAQTVQQEAPAKRGRKAKETTVAEPATPQAPAPTEPLAPAPEAASSLFDAPAKTSNVVEIPPVQPSAPVQAEQDDAAALDAQLFGQSPANNQVPETTMSPEEFGKQIRSLYEGNKDKGSPKMLVEVLKANDLQGITNVPAAKRQRIIDQFKFLIEEASKK